MTAEERARNWLIKFEDQDCRDEVFSDEASARATLAQHQHHWACHLFVQDEQLAEERALADRLAADLRSLQAAIVGHFNGIPNDLSHQLAQASEGLAAHAKARK